MGLHKRVKSHFSSSVLVLAWGRGENESVMALTGFLSVDIIATVPSDYIFVNKGEMGSHISGLKW